MNAIKARNETLAKMSNHAVAALERARGTPQEAAARRKVERNIEMLKAVKAESDALKAFRAAPARRIGG